MKKEIKMTIKEMTITMHMWGMAAGTINTIVRKITNGNQHTYRNGMTYDPKNENLTN